MIYVVMGGDDVGSTLRSRERHDNSRVRRFFLSVLPRCNIRPYHIYGERLGSPTSDNVLHCQESLLT